MTGVVLSAVGTAVVVLGVVALALWLGRRRRPAPYVVRVIDLCSGRTVEMWPSRRRGKALARLTQLTRQRNPWHYRVVLHRAGER